VAGHIDYLLPNCAKMRRVEDHPALPYDEAADFFKARAHDGVAASALQLLILTAIRTSETIGAI
jgi:integrase